MYHSTFILPSDHADRLEDVSGLAFAQRILGLGMLVDAGGGEQYEFFLAFDRPSSDQTVTAGFPRREEPAVRLRELGALHGPGEVIRLQRPRPQGRHPHRRPGPPDDSSTNGRGGHAPHRLDSAVAQLL